MSAPVPAPWLGATHRRAILIASATTAASFSRASPAHGRATARTRKTAHTPSSTPDVPLTRLELRGRRLVAVGDLHGDFLALVRAMELAGVMDGDGRWVGGDCVVVQVGDVLDRGDSEIAIMRKLRALRKQARAAGGDVVCMNGNHEIMTVMGDFRYATPGAFEECRRYYKKRVTQDAKDGTGVVESLDDEGDEEMAGVRARQMLFKPGGEIAMWLSQQPTVLVVDNGTVFAHAGIDISHVEYGFERINKEVSMWMQGKTKMPPKQVLDSDGVVWTRDYGGRDAGVQYEASACRKLSTALDAVGAKRLVVGHTPQTTGVTNGCKGALWRVDVGASRGIYGHDVQVIEIVNGRTRVLA